MGTVSSDEYQKLCDQYDLFKKIGFEGFETKLWLVFKALNDGIVSEESVASKPCQSLMEYGVPFHKIKDYLDELIQNEILYGIGDNQFKLKPRISYNLHNICYQLTSKITESGLGLHELVKECGYTYDTRNRELVQNFNNGDINAKAQSFKDLMTQLAFAGAKLFIKITNEL